MLLQAAHWYQKFYCVLLLLEPAIYHALKSSFSFYYTTIVYNDYYCNNYEGTESAEPRYNYIHDYYT